MKKIYRLEIVQADDDWFHVRRYPKFDVGTSYQLLYYSMEEIEAYIKLAIEKDAFADLICFIDSSAPRVPFIALSEYRRFTLRDFS